MPWLLGVLLVMMQAVPGIAPPAAALKGVVVNDDGGVRGVTVVLLRADVAVATTITDADGAFAFPGLDRDTYAIEFTLGEQMARLDSVIVQAGATTTIEQRVPWRAGFGQSVTVYAASRRLERIVEAPSAITSVPLQAIELQSASGQVPRLLEFTPGVQTTQSGLYDFNLNVRGFNTHLTRRIQTIVDGRDPSIPFLSSQEWASFALALDDIASVELMRGPSAALYGPNSFNGVLNIQTLAPRESQGGRVKVLFGDLNTAGVSGRWAGGIGREWFLKAIGGYLRSGDFSRSRNESVEYGGVPLEAIPLPTRHDAVAAGSLRADKYLANGRVLTLEAGVSSIAGPVLLTTTGRAQPDAVRTWTRVNVNSAGWNALAYTNTRNSDDRPSPTSGAPLWAHDTNARIEFQGNRAWRQGAIRVVAGGAYGRQSVDTSDDRGVQTLLSRAVVSHLGGLFAQADLRPTRRVKLVVASRWDASTLHDAQFSPKVAAVFDLSPRQAIRVSYNRAFQVANYAELFVQVPAGPPLDLSRAEAAFAPLLGDVRLGLGLVPLLVRGNEQLRVERIRGFEAGYRGMVGEHAFVAADVYYTRMRDFITDALPGVNPQYPPWAPPATLSEPARSIVQRALNEAIPGLSNDPATGAPIFVLSLGNAGEVDSHGMELGVNWMVHPRVMLDANYGWFGFTVREKSFAADVHPNVPAHQASGGLSYLSGPVTAALHYRWADRFQWASGIFVGPVPAYGVATLDASYRLQPGWSLGVNVSNLLNNVHYEVFGGDLLRRRVVGWLGRSWK